MNRRCKSCKKEYSNGSGEYFVSLKSMYVRVGTHGKQWKKVGFYCPVCKRFYEK